MCVLERAGRGWRVRGTVLTHEAKQPIELRYAVTVDSAWATTDVEVLVAIAGGEPRELAELSGVWSRVGTPAPVQRLRRRRSQLHAGNEHAPDPTPRSRDRRGGRDPRRLARLARAQRPAGAAAVHQARGGPLPLQPGRVRGRADRRPARARSRVRGALARDRLELRRRKAAPFPRVHRRQPHRRARVPRDPGSLRPHRLHTRPPGTQVSLPRAAVGTMSTISPPRCRTAWSCMLAVVQAWFGITVTRSPISGGSAQALTST